MVTLYVAGQKVSWADAEQLFAETARSQPVEFRDGNGCVIATTVPVAEPDPDWVKGITPEEIARRQAGPFFTLDEYRQRTGQP